MQIREYSPDHLKELLPIWNSIVEDGTYFPQEYPMNLTEAQTFFAEQNDTYCALDKGHILGFYILHPNEIGRRSHIANASYGVSGNARGKGLGKKLVLHSLAQCKAKGFVGLQYNAVVDTNERAVRLYMDLGFTHIGCVPDGFRLENGSLTGAHIFYINTQN